MEFNGIQRSISAGSQNRSSGVSSRKTMTVCQIVICELCNKFNKGPINSIIKSKTRLISHVNPGYVTLRNERSAKIPTQVNLLPSPVLRSRIFRIKYSVCVLIYTYVNILSRVLNVSCYRYLCNVALVGLLGSISLAARWMLVLAVSNTIPL
jgi:hypothetical protein